MRVYSILPVSVCALLGNAALAVSIDLVTVGNPRNAPDAQVMLDTTSGYGSVGYTFQIGKFEVTAGQYCEFLNAVAATDAYGLYDANMDTRTNSYGCNIQRSGTSGNYTYSVASDWANRPVNWINWGDAVRFCNWLNNGQPTGAQGLATTEDGSYYLNGAVTDADLMSVSRKADARYVIPSENEWYKAAYYDPNKPSGAGYWRYPTRSNTAPSNVLSATRTNNANYWNGSYTIGAPYWRTEVGAFAGSPSAYGTFDQGGNVWEWNEANVEGIRGMRGGSFYGYNLQDVQYLLAGWRSNYYPSVPSSDFGFRIALVPEPATLAILAAAALGVGRRRRTR